MRVCLLLVALLLLLRMRMRVDGKSGKFNAHDIVRRSSATRALTNILHNFSIEIEFTVSLLCFIDASSSLK